MFDSCRLVYLCCSDWSLMVASLVAACSCSVSDWKLSLLPNWLRLVTVTKGGGWPSPWECGGLYGGMWGRTG